MLVNGAALRNTHIESWVGYRNPGYGRQVLIVECDDEWDADGNGGRGRHIHHSREDHGTYDDCDEDILG